MSDSQARAQYARRIGVQKARETEITRPGVSVQPEQDRMKVERVLAQRREEIEKATSNLTRMRLVTAGKIGYGAGKVTLGGVGLGTSWLTGFATAPWSVGAIGSGASYIGVASAEYNRNAREVHHFVEHNKLKNKRDVNVYKEREPLSGFSPRDRSRYFRYGRENGEISPDEYVKAMDEAGLRREVEKAKSRENSEKGIAAGKFLNSAFSLGGADPAQMGMSLMGEALSKAGPAVVSEHMAQIATFNRMEAEFLLKKKQFGDTPSKKQTEELEKMQTSMLRQMDETQTVATMIRNEVNDPKKSELERTALKKLMRSGEVGSSIGLKPERVAYLEAHRKHLLEAEKQKALEQEQNTPQKVQPEKQMDHQKRRFQAQLDRQKSGHVESARKDALSMEERRAKMNQMRQQARKPDVQGPETPEPDKQSASKPKGRSIDSDM